MKVLDSKSSVRVSVPWVRIPPSPYHLWENATLAQASRVGWRGDRVVEGARLEIVCRETYRGFESLSLRQYWGVSKETSHCGRESAMETP